MQGARFFDDIYAASGTKRLLLVDDLFTRQLAGHFAVPAAWLQPVLLIARERGLVTDSDYTRLITDLIDIGQSFIGIDPSVLLHALDLDRKSGGPVPGRRFSLVCRSLGGLAADPHSHCKTVIGFLRSIWNRNAVPLEIHAATSQALRAVLRERSADYPLMLTSIYADVYDRPVLCRFILAWARGHFLRWP